MTTESDSNSSNESKNREVYRQEQQRIAEESHLAGPGEPRKPKNRGEVAEQERRRIAEESHQVGT